jgi:translocation protein SEC72
MHGPCQGCISNKGPVTAALLKSPSGFFVFSSTIYYFNSKSSSLSSANNMATTDDALETYTHLPIHIDPASKSLSVTSSDRAVQDAISHVNSLHSSFKKLETPNNLPPPPMPVDPKRSAQIQKLRESAGAAARKGNHVEAIRLLTFAIDMAASRPGWEPAGLVREELAVCYFARGAANMESKNWVEGWKDAECSTVCKSGPQQTPQGQRVPGNPQAFLIGGKCLMEMGRNEEAVKWLEKALDVEGREGPPGQELMKMLAEAKKKVEGR